MDSTNHTWTGKCLRIPQEELEDVTGKKSGWPCSACCQGDTEPDEWYENNWADGKRPFKKDTAKIELLMLG